MLGDLSAPFHLHFVVLTAILLTAGYACLNRFQPSVSCLLLWLLPVLSPYFLHRILMVRPHVLFVSLFFVACGLVFDGQRTRRGTGRWLLVLGVLSAYCYSNPHFLLLPVVVRAACTLVRYRRLEWRLLAYGAGGILVGLTFHPQFPNTFLLWWVQCVRVTGAILSGTPELRLGTEMAAPGWEAVLRETPLFAIAACHVGLMLRRRRWHWSDSTVWAVVQEAVVLAGFLLCVRAIEYGVPAVLIASACVARDAAPRVRLAALGGPRTFGVGAALVCLTATYTLPRFYAGLGPGPFSAEYARLGVFLRKEMSAGEVIANLNWTDFPRLFHAAPHCRFLVGLDPYFGAAADRPRMVAIERFRHSADVLRSEQLGELVSADYAFVSVQDRYLLRKMVRSGFDPVYQGPEGVLFRLAPSETRRPGSQGGRAGDGGSETQGTAPLAEGNPGTDDARTPAAERHGGR